MLRVAKLRRGSCWQDCMLWQTFIADHVRPLLAGNMWVVANRCSLLVDSPLLLGGGVWEQSKVQGGQVYNWVGPHGQRERLELTERFHIHIKYSTKLFHCACILHFQHTVFHSHSFNHFNVNCVISLIKLPSTKIWQFSNFRVFWKFISSRWALRMWPFDPWFRNVFSNSFSELLDMLWCNCWILSVCVCDCVYVTVTVCVWLCVCECDCVCVCVCAEGPRKLTCVVVSSSLNSSADNYTHITIKTH